MQKIYVLAGAALIMAACGGSEKDYDATGTFEAIETTVFAEQSGALLSFDVNDLVREINQENAACVQQSVHEIEMLKEIYDNKYTTNH